MVPDFALSLCALAHVRPDPHHETYPFPWTNGYDNLIVSVVGALAKWCSALILGWQHFWCFKVELKMNKNRIHIHIQHEPKFSNQNFSEMKPRSHRISQSNPKQPLHELGEKKKKMIITSYTQHGGIPFTLKTRTLLEIWSACKNYTLLSYRKIRIQA